ncbi:hypothetical protein RvY_14836 [Ramazzottius varieornatus]|uniref:Uncharacterized protein n=1 Tax=Ramazzottius varieornatus TaxID=947166 RepID=A0A1D1W121_RAMVA|nr:hypothetical protein RvY_14836 [Ramazzottius varieornatus]
MWNVLKYCGHMECSESTGSHSIFCPLLCVHKCEIKKIPYCSRMTPGKSVRLRITVREEFPYRRGLWKVQRFCVLVDAYRTQTPVVKTIWLLMRKFS